MEEQKRDVAAVENNEEEYDKGPKMGMRHIQVIMLFLLLAIGYGMRVCLSVAIVAMTDTNKTTTPNPDIPVYDWDNNSVILSSFYWGYICLQLIAGELGNRYGCKWLLVGSMFINSSACMLTPLVADHIGSYGVMGCRVVQGLSQGFFFPSVHNLLGKWAPLTERSLLGTVAFAGPAFGTIFGMVITGYIAASWVGWPISFYFFGTLGYCWMAAWSFLGADNPVVHPKISEKEKLYILNSLSASEDTKPPKTPWKAIFTSLPVWAFVVGNFGQNWGYSTLLTEIPTYMNKIMEFDMNANGLLSGAPYLASFIFSFVFGSMSDYLINHNYINRQNARKLFNSIGTVFPAVALVTLSFLPDGYTTLSVFLLIMAVGLNAGVFVGFQINAVDLAPRFSGILMGLGNGASNTFSIVAPLVVQAVVGDHQKDKSLWRIVFLIASSIYVASDIFFIFFASGTVQWWDNIEEDSVSAGEDERRMSLREDELRLSLKGYDQRMSLKEVEQRMSDSIHNKRMSLR